MFTWENIKTILMSIVLRQNGVYADGPLPVDNTYNSHINEDSVPSEVSIESISHDQMTVRRSSNSFSSIDDTNSNDDNNPFPDSTPIILQLSADNDEGFVPFIGNISNNSMPSTPNSVLTNEYANNCNRGGQNGAHAELSSLEYYSQSVNDCRANPPHQMLLKQSSNAVSHIDDASPDDNNNSATVKPSAGYDFVRPSPLAYDVSQNNVPSTPKSVPISPLISEHANNCNRHYQNGALLELSSLENHSESFNDSRPSSRLQVLQRPSSNSVSYIDGASFYANNSIHDSSSVVLQPSTEYDFDGFPPVNVADVNNHDVHSTPSIVPSNPIISEHVTNWSRQCQIVVQSELSSLERPLGSNNDNRRSFGHQTARLPRRPCSFYVQMIHDFNNLANAPHEFSSVLGPRFLDLARCLRLEQDRRDSSIATNSISANSQPLELRFSALWENLMDLHRISEPTSLFNNNITTCATSALELERRNAYDNRLLSFLEVFRLSEYRMCEFLRNLPTRNNLASSPLTEQLSTSLCLTNMFRPGLSNSRISLRTIASMQSIERPLKNSRHNRLIHLFGETRRSRIRRLIRRTENRRVVDHVLPILLSRNTTYRRPLSNSRGLTADQIDRLTSLISYEKKVDNEQPEKCSICINEFEQGENIRRLCCCHLFHPDCIECWFIDNRQCPNCRFCM